MSQPSPTQPCPSAAELAELVAGRLDDATHLRLATHVASCTACAGVAGGVTLTTPASALAASLEGDLASPKPSTAEAPTLEASQEGPPIRPSGAPRPPVLPRGAPIGRYLIVSLLGRGGMGEVYAAYDPELDRRVALKLLHTSRGSVQARRRLLREARALGKLSHPNVVQVYDVGEHAGDVFLTMELVEGQPLDAWCQGSPRPGWQEVVTAYVDAARGLAAAHDKGIVHRDVKPANILRGKDGRVRVADFGIAAGRGEAGVDPPPDADPQKGAPPRAAPSPSPVAATIEASWSSLEPRGGRLTATGALLGTPLYMAPEQFEGPGVGPASDQHSLCTALYQALYGELPFPFAQGPGLLLELVTRKRLGPPSSPPLPAHAAAGEVPPAWLYRVIARGLAPRPEDRYPTISDLADALVANPEQRRPPRLRLAIAAGAVAIAGVVALVGARRGAFESPCAHPEHQLVEAWDAGVRGRVRAALLDTARSYAGDTASRVERILDGYAASWTKMRGEVCEASRSGAQRREVVRLRDECLDRRLGALKALTTLVGERADVQILDKAVQAALGLPPIASCAEVETLTARVRPPEDPALRARVAELEPRVDRLEALYRAGRYKEGLVAGEPLLVETAAVAHAPLRARVHISLGELRGAVGDYEGAKAAFREAAAAGAEGRDDVITATAWARVLFVLGERQRRLDEAAVVRSFGPTLISRAHDERADSWLNAEALFLTRKARRDEAKAVHEHAVTLGEKVLGPDHLELSTPLNNLGILLVEMGDVGAAMAVFERALAIREKALGPEHPFVGATLNNLGLALSATGARARAAAAYQRALAVWERGLGPEHPHVAQALNNLGNELLYSGAWTQARAHYERSLSIREKALGPEHPDVAQTLYGLGTVLRSLDDLPGSEAALERARAISERALGPDHADVAYSLAGLGRTLVRERRFDEAQRQLERALALRERTGGPRAPAITEPLLGLGELHLARGKPDEAAPPLERALEMHDAEVEPEVRLALAEALWQIGHDRARAHRLAEQARARYEQDGHRLGVERATRWLGTHPG